MLLKTRAVVPKEAVRGWKFLLWGLWLSGLRIGEAHKLRWHGGGIYVGSLSVAVPILHIMAEAQKGRRDEQWPMPPAFARFLGRVPETDRKGFVFSPKLSGCRAGYDAVKHTVSAIGTAAKIKVGTRTKLNEETGQREKVVKYASAHDLRRSFIQRWSKRVPRRKLQLLARHRSYQTTEAYYLEDDREELGREMWRRFGDHSGDQVPKPTREG